MAQSDGPKAGASGSARSRCIALVGPYLSGKTTLLEAILARTGAVTRQGSVADKNKRRRRQPRSPRPRHERRAQRRRRHFPRRQLHLHRLPRLDRIPARGRARAHGLRRGRRRVRARPQARPGAAAHPQAARGPRHSPLPVPQQDRLHSKSRVRDILPMLQPASAKPLVLRQIPIWENGVATGFVDLALGARLRLPHAGAVGDRRDARDRHGAREGGALPHAGAARRLRRRADGAAAVRRAAAARQGLRRISTKEMQRRPDRAGAARLGARTATASCGC